MSFDVVLWVHVFLIATSLVLGVLAVMTFNRRNKAPEASAFGWLVVTATIYVFGYAGEVSQTTVGAAHHWLMFEQLALPWLPGFWLLAAYRHNGKKAPVAALFIVPVITFFGEYSNPWLGLFHGPLTLVQRGPFFVLEFHRGPLAILANIYLLLACLGAPWLYIARFRHSSSLFRRQATAVIFSSIFPLGSYFLYLAGWSPWGLDIAPLALAISAFIFYYGVFRLSTFDLDPMARNLVFNGIRDAVIIMDDQERLLDFNAAAVNLISGLSDADVGSESDPQYYDVRTFPLQSRKKELGRATILADVTSQANLREELRVHAETDSLTGIANRRRFLQAMQLECARYNRYKGPFSVLLIDIDHFKDVNDLHGHPAGDAVLRAVVERLKPCFREIDLFARHGGEEFAVLLVGAGKDAASEVAEKLRYAVAMKPFDIEGLLLSITVSIGFVTQTGDSMADAEALLKRADIALYLAKAAGRNRVESAADDAVI